MKKFIYTAKDLSGQTIKGEVEAPNEYLAAKLVRERGLIVISIRSGENIFTSFNKLRFRITSSDVTSFTRQFATMINAGIPITEALSILRLQSNPSLQRIVAQLLADVEGGKSLSIAMSAHPKVFSPTYIALVKSGESGGVLDTVLVRLSDNLEREQEFKGKIKGALIYPVIIVIGMIIVVFIMMVFVVPRLTDIYKQFNAKLPIMTEILIAVSTFFANAWPLVIAAVGAIYWGLTLYRRTPSGRRKMDELVFKIPLIGEFQMKVFLAEVTRTLSLMFGAGVTILEGLDITSNVISNVVISDALKDSAKQVEKGFPVSFAFAKHPEAFPYLVSQMVAIGEETGKMDEVLTKVSHIYEVESDQKVKALTAAFEPIIMVILGLGVAFLVVAIILPIYNLTSSI